ncbi:MAG: DUF4153 domain-containing protein [Oscillospiraceae bacterium]|nr:DUF4153 domain-containing protein [Oscillospiraceae bacterium]
MLIFILILVIIAAGASFTVARKRKQNSDGSKNGFFSVSSMTEKLLLLLKRFPISILLVVGLAMLFFVAVNDDFDNIPYQLWIFFSVGAFLSVTAILFSEDFLDNLKTHGIALFAVLLWGVYCIFLPEKSEDMQIGKGIEMFVISGAVFFSMAFISFLKKNQDRAFWNFAAQTFFQMALACVFGAILFGGLSLALLAIDSLFNVLIDSKVYFNLAVICYALFSPIYFLTNIPDKTEKHSNEIFYAKTQKILALYILAPILAVYVIILYAYLFKIVVDWELPNGWVSWLVSALALGGLLVITVLYPVREQEQNKAVTFISRWFGLLILPLLALMTIGIFRRIADYGITINRGYVLLLNLWFYGIYIYLFLSQSRHIKWILISPIVVALLTSVSIWGVANVTKNSLTKEVSAVFNKPTSSEEARAIVAKMTEEEKNRMRSTLEYLHNNFGKESIQPFFTNTLSGSYWSFSDLGLREIFDEQTEKIERIVYHTNDEKTWEIEGYSAFRRIDYINYRASDDTEYSLKNDTLEISCDNRIFPVPMREIALEYLSTDEYLRNEQEWIVRGDGYAILISQFYGDYYPEQDSIFINSLGGYLFYKKK